MFFPAHLPVSGRTVLLRHILRLMCLAVIALKSVDLTAARPPAVQPVPEAPLLALAQKKFGTLSRAEEELFRAAQEGRAASALAVDEKESDPAKAANWPADRAVRAACISWICTDPPASALVTHRGLRLEGMRIDGEFDLRNADINFQVLAWKCAFADNIYLQDAQTRGFYLVDCQIEGLQADRAILKGSVLLRVVKAEGEVNLSGTTISGDLDCTGAQFLNANTERKAFTANSAKIQGSVYLNNGFKAGREVNLVATTIGGDLDCSGGQFSNPEGVALNANGAKIERSVYLRGPFKAEGEVDLGGATIGATFECDGGQFSNANGLALNANGAKIKGAVFLHNGFKAEGEVNLLGTTIGGELSCLGGQFSNPGGLALNAESAKIDGNVHLRDEFRAQGKVSLVGARIRNLQILGVIGAEQTIFDFQLTRVEGFWDDPRSWPKAGNLFLDGFRYDRLYEARNRKKWLGLQPRDEFRPQPYEQLATVLRQMGHEREAREVMIWKNQERAKFTQFPHGEWWWYNCFGWLIGYGYAPWRAFAISVAMILFGAFLFRCGFRHGLIAPTSDNAYAKEPHAQLILENGQPKISETYPVFNALVYSLESFVPLLGLDQSTNWTPNANRRSEISIFHRRVPCSGSFLRYYLYFHIAAGWLLTSLWVGAITGLVKT